MQLTNRFLFAYTAGFPVPVSTDLEDLSGAVATDGAGRIAGLVYARVYFDGHLKNPDNYGAYTVNVTGNTTDRGTNPLVTVRLKGNGYTFDGVSNHPNASLTLKFVSTNRFVDVPALPVPVNSTNYSVTFADGSTQVFTNGPTNLYNSAYTFLSGWFRGTVGVGTRSPVNGGQPVKVDETAALVTDRTIWTPVNATNFVEQVVSGGLALDVLTNIDAQVVQPVPSSKLFISAYVGSHQDLFYASGSANTNSGTWSASWSGVAFGHGSTMRANGKLGPVIIGWQSTTDTNTFPGGYIPLIVPNALKQIAISGGRIFGHQLRKTGGFSVDAPRPSAPGS